MNKEQRNLALRLGASLLVAPIGAAMGIGMIIAFDKAFGLPAGKTVRKATVAEYNDAVAQYNASVIRFNKAMEGAMGEVPELKQLMLQIDQEDYNLVFDDIMRKNFLEGEES